MPQRAKKGELDDMSPAEGHAPLYDEVQFQRLLTELLAEADRLRATPRSALDAKPEDITIERLLRPLFQILNYGAPDYLLPQARIRGPAGLSEWVDFALVGADRRLLAFVEAKPIWDDDLWRAYGHQVKQYLRDYHLKLERPTPVRWLVLTNFREFHFVNMFDRHPFLVLTAADLNRPDNQRILWQLLERHNLERDLIFAKYTEASRQPLDEQFLLDLNQWRQIVANGIRAANPHAPLADIARASALLLNRAIFVRVLETLGLHVYYSVPKEWHHWKTVVRNVRQFPFRDVLNRLYNDLELDLNTDLLKPEHEVPPIDNEYLAAFLIPDEVMAPEVSRAAGVQPSLLPPRTVYSYDFDQLTADILGAVYERYLAHSLAQDGDLIRVSLDQSVRQREGAYFTRPEVARYLVEAALEPIVKPAIHEALQLLHQERFDDAYRVLAERVATVRVLDPACGSGAFLMTAFDVLVAAYEAYNHAVRRITGTRFTELLTSANPGPQSFPDFARFVVEHQLFGIDKDPQAVEVTRLNLWLKLLRTDSAAYQRRNGSPPPARLPSLERNILARDFILPRWDVRTWIGDGHLVVVGNPPWGATLGRDSDLASAGYASATGQYDSYEVFLEQALSLLVTGERLSFLIPDSLFLPEHERTRRQLLHTTAIERITRLGEGLFHGVFRAAVGIVVRKGAPDADHRTRCALITKAGRQALFDRAHPRTLMDIEAESAHLVQQSRFSRNAGAEFDILIAEADEPIIQAMECRRLNWDEAFDDARGVEITKDGLVVRCPYCGIWNNVPRKNRQGVYLPKTCQNPQCGRQFTVGRGGVAPESIIRNIPGPSYQPIIVGEAVHRYRIVQYSYIDVTRVREVPLCPHCGHFDAQAVPTVDTWVCPHCRQRFHRGEVRRTRQLGIRYKSPALYAPPKLVIRKTGRGIYATIDETDALTNQVVFIFRPKPGSPVSVYYVLGVLNSRLMLYYYYKRTAEVEWRSFPYLTQHVIKTLPVRLPDPSDARERLLHDQIADSARWLSSHAGDPGFAQKDQECEQLVRTLYGILPEWNARIDNELDRISQLGTLLATPEDDDEEDDDDGAEE